MGETQVFTDFITGAKYGDLPQEVVKRAKTSISDLIACGLGGRRTKEGDLLLDMMKYLGGKPAATVFGDRTKLPFMQAIQVNRVISNMLDYDDTHMRSGHMSSCLVPTALGIGERVKASGKAVINALVAGYEAVSRIRRAIDPTEEAFWKTFERVDSGLHFGVTAVAGKLLGLDNDQMASAFGLTGMVRIWRIAFPDRPKKGMPPWMKITGGDHTIPGIHSVLLAKRGFPGDKGLLDAGRGYHLTVGSDRYDATFLVKDLGSHYETMRIGYKFYSSCRHTSTTADAIAFLMEEHGISAEDVDQVVVKVQKIVADNFAIYEPTYMIQAQFSIPYVAAMVLLDEPTGPNWYTEEMLHDPRVRQLHHRVKVVEDPGAGHKFYSEHKSPSTVEISTRDGKTFSRSVEYPRGEPENPFSAVDHLDKLWKMASYAGIGKERIEKLIEKLDKLEKIKDIREVTRLLVPDNIGDRPAS